MSTVYERLVMNSLEAAPGERAIVITNPTEPASADDKGARGEMAREFVRTFTEKGAETVLLLIEEGKAHNAPLPPIGLIDAREVDPAGEIRDRSIAVAVTTHSLTAPLATIIREEQSPRLRAISMPGVRRRSLQTALLADQRTIARRAAILKPLLDMADGANVVFSTGDEMFFDLRGSTAATDDGYCGRPGQIINAPFGEVYAVPRERESRSAGKIPLYGGGEIATLRVEGNNIVGVSGAGKLAQSWEKFFGGDPARCNVAEFGLGLNDRAVVVPGENYILEEEKAEGFHWAFGRSDHFGGCVGPQHFSPPSNCVHQDVVYNRDTPVGVARLDLIFGGSPAQTVIIDNRYKVF